MKSLPVKTMLLNIPRLVFRNRVMEAVLFSLTNGKSWDQLIARLPANYYQYPKGSLRNVKRDGFNYQLDISDYMQWLIYFGIRAEPRETLYGLIKQGMTILDIGANIGETSMAFSQLTGDSGKVFSFEPDPQTFERLKKHLVLNKCENVIPVNKGLGKTEGEMLLEEGENNSGGNRISPDKQSTNGKKIIITTLDKFSLEHDLKKIDFIKIDVEGYEFHVLAGAEESISKHRPCFFIELVDDFLKDQGTSSKKLIEFLVQKKYKVTNANDGAPVSADDNFSHTHFDIIAIPA
ncbi:MAG: FkbM family methyltransferase [Bacteroidota bacterium]|nr:FkbM family methyltransferase [Bacteroidota bacterium]